MPKANDALDAGDARLKRDVDSLLFYGCDGYPARRRFTTSATRNHLTARPREK